MYTFTEEDLANEIWKDVLGYGGYYAVSNLGRIKSLDRYARNNINGGKRYIPGRIISQKTKSNGYKEVSINIDRSKRSRYVHRLVCEAFFGKIEDKLAVNHKDGDKSNNRLDNLEICTYSQNSKHSYHVLNNKLKPLKGEGHARSKLKEEEVIHIKSSYIKGSSNAEIHSTYKGRVSKTQINSIMYGLSWKHLNHYSKY